jgi:ribosomal-protein-serine acetyltransferase
VRFAHQLAGDGDLELSPWEVDMADAMTEVIVANREHLMRFLSWPTPDYNRDAAMAFIHQAQRQYADEGILALGIWERGVLVGGIGMNTTVWRTRSTALGYWLAASAQGRGIMTRAVRSVVDELLGPRGFERVVIAAQPENRASCAVAERLGFRREGVARHAFRHGDRFIDWAVYAMLSEEWRNAR